MATTLSSTGQHHNGPRPINLNTDIPQVVHLLEDVFGERMTQYGQAENTPAFLWRLNPTLNRLSPGFVWEEDGRIVGNATLLKSKLNGRYLVVNVAVHPQYRRRGIAKHLMEMIIDWVYNNRGHTILLQVVKENSGAVNLYQRLNFLSLGSMTSWTCSVSRIREIDVGGSWYIRELRSSEWRQAYQLDQQALLPDLNWPEPLPHDAYRVGWWARLQDMLNGRQTEIWTIPDQQDRLMGIATIMSEWGRAHYANVRVHPEMQGELERPLFAKLTRRFRYLPYRNIRIAHPDDDESMNQLLRLANFQPRRTLTHMRLDL